RVHGLATADAEYDDPAVVDGKSRALPQRDQVRLSDPEYAAGPRHLAWIRRFDLDLRSLFRDHLADPPGSRDAGRPGLRRGEKLFRHDMAADVVEQPIPVGLLPGR